MVVTKNNGKNEKLFRETCYEAGDNISILTSDMRFTYITEEDIETIIKYGWGEDDLNNIVGSDERADEITRLTAWIRDAGELDHGLIIEDDPHIQCELDEDNNYPEPTEAF